MRAPLRLQIDGLLQPARLLRSPNCDRRPHGVAIDALIIHAISLPPGEYGGGYVEKFFCNQLNYAAHAYFETLKDLRVSAHFFIDREGRLTQFVPTTHRAWHAGESRLNGRERVNDFSIGVELEGCDDDQFEDAQYAQLAALARCLMENYRGITESNIAGHSDIAPGRKTDPGPGFDWLRFRKAVGG